MHTQQEKITARPILFTPDMVRAILDRRKTQTRRIIKPQPRQDGSGGWEYGKDYRNSCSAAASPATDVLFPYECPYGTPGHHLWVRETWAMVPAPPPEDFGYIYKADFDDDPFNWRPSIYMPRAASRIHLEITHIRAQRLHDITEADAIAEGVEQGTDWFVDYAHHDKTYAAISARHSYSTLWEKINGPHSWDANPWVWVITFKKIG